MQKIEMARKSDTTSKIIANVNKFPVIVTFAVMSFGADKDFNGRWNLTVEKEPRGRAWWLEVTGAGTPAIAGRFVGAPGGQMDKIPLILIAKKESLRFGFEKADRKHYYTASIEKGELIGQYYLDGKLTLTFRGVRAPVIRDRDGDQWKLGKTEDLMKSLDGWQTTFPGRTIEWTLANGVMKNAPKASDIRTKETYWNLELHAEYRYEKGSNSGIGLRGRYEVQIQDTHGEPVSGHSHGALYSRIVPTADAANAPGEWQTLDVRLVGRTVTVKLNGKVIIDHQEIEGPTAMCFDPNEAMPGPIAVQGDHGVVEFRKLTVTPLTRS